MGENRVRGLILAEKPSLGRIIQASVTRLSSKGMLKDTFDVAMFRGHSVGLMEPREYGGKWDARWSWEMLPVIPETFRYKVTDRETYSALKKKLDTGHYDFLVNACDPDREGNHIFTLFYNQTGSKLPYKRFWSNELTDDKVDAALMHLRYEGDGLLPDLKCQTEAAVMRARFDWLFGMNCTIAGTLAMGSTAKIGRVKTPTLAILAKREDEIANFVPETRYELEAEYAEGFTGTLFGKDGTVSFASPNGFADIKAKLGNTAEVVSAEKKTEKSNPPELYNLSVLQGDASQRFGLGPDATLATVQSLYEKKILSYPRTDCRRVGSDTAKSFPELLKRVATDTALAQFCGTVTPQAVAQTERNRNVVDDAALKEGGHYALIPTLTYPEWGTLTADEKNILDLVYRRFLAVFMPPALTDKMQVVTSNNGYTFRSSGKHAADPGWQALYINSKDTLLPPLAKGQKVSVKGFRPAEKTTKPPKRYSDGDLVLAMANPVKFLADAGYKNILNAVKGIGTEATRAKIISSLVSDGYAELKTAKGKGKASQFYVTPQGMALYHNFMDTDFTKVDMTGIWETKLASVAAGTMPAAQFDSEMREYTLSQIEAIKKGGEDGSIRKFSFADSAEVIGVCPHCGGSVVEGKSYYFCRNYRKTCDFIFKKDWYGARISVSEAKKILAGKKSKVYDMKSDGKEWKTSVEYVRCVKEDPKDGVRKDFGRVDFSPREDSTPAQAAAAKMRDSRRHAPVQIGNCPLCGKPVTYDGAKAECACGWHMYGTLKGAYLDDAAMKTLVSGGIVQAEFDRGNGEKAPGGLRLAGGVPSFLRAGVTEEQAAAEDAEAAARRHAPAEAGKCPKCRKKMMCDGAECRCPSCGHRFSMKMHGEWFTDAEAQALLSGQKVSKEFTWNSGKRSAADVKLEKGYPRFQFGK